MLEVTGSSVARVGAVDGPASDVSPCGARADNMYLSAGLPAMHTAIIQTAVEALRCMMCGDAVFESFVYPIVEAWSSDVKLDGRSNSVSSWH